MRRTTLAVSPASIFGHLEGRDVAYWPDSEPPVPPQAGSGRWGKAVALHGARETARLTVQRS
jgi:hypothetical protein